MSDKAILSRRDMSNDATRQRMAEDAREGGFAIERQLPQGTLVRIDDNQRVSLEEQGYRVKVLPDTNLLKIGSYAIDVEASRTQPDVPENLRVPADLEQIWRHYLVQLAAPPADDWVHEIEARGVSVIEPVSDYGLYVVGDPAAVMALKEELDFVEWVGPFQPAYKIGAGLLGHDGALRLEVSVFPPEDIAQVKETLASLGATIVRETVPPKNQDRDYATLVAEFRAISNEQIATLARLQSVHWLETAGWEPGLEGERDTQIVAGILTGSPRYQAWLTGVGFSGAGAVIAIGDSGVDGNSINNVSGHPDLRGRQQAFVNYTDVKDAKDVKGHGTLVASIAVGNAATREVEAPAPNDFLLGQGVAPGARFISQNITLAPGGSPDLAALTRDAVNHGAHVLNISWNDQDKPGAGYTPNARLLDMCVRNPTGLPNDSGSLTIVASAGNVGPAPCHITPPKEAKNLIVVGASLSASAGSTLSDDLWISSSRGPAVDQRYLPTLVAPGTHVTGAASAWAHMTFEPGSTQYVSDAGTSMASPFVAGCCAVLIEWWRDHNGGKAPSPAMLKALLINGADDLAGGDDGNGGILTHIPNNDQGWGRVNLRNIIEALPDSPNASRGPRIFSDQSVAFSAYSQDHLICVRPHAQARPMRVTLVWTDAPGTIQQDPARANDLDLEVVHRSTQAIFKGNQFVDGFSVSDSNRVFDRLNNVECVYISQPSGTYEVRVIPATVTRNARPPFSGPAWQDFALVIENAVEAPC